MIYLSGCITQSALNNPRPDFGFMLQPAIGNRVDTRYHVWAADNGCYSAGENFDDGAWLEWLARMRPHADSCLFAVAPDVPYDWQATLDRSWSYFDLIRKLGYRPALAAQDGMPLRILDLSGFDVLFLGGTDRFKVASSTFALAAKARRQGRWVHMGRVNTLDRLNRAALGCLDSVDGTYVAYGPDTNLPKVCGWLDRVNGCARDDGPLWQSPLLEVAG